MTVPWQRPEMCPDPESGFAWSLVSQYLKLAASTDHLAKERG